MKAVALGVLVALAACTGGGRGGEPLTVTASGATVAPPWVSVAAELTEDRPSAALDVTLRIELLDAAGRRIAVVHDSLPACDGTCHYGGTFSGDQFGRRWREVREARVTARASHRGRAPSHRLVPVERADDGSLRGSAPASGVVYVVARRDGRPVAGIYRALVPNERRWSIPRALFPPLEGETLLAWYLDVAPARHE